MPGRAFNRPKKKFVSVVTFDAVFWLDILVICMCGTCTLSVNGKPRQRQCCLEYVFLCHVLEVDMESILL